MHSRIGKTQSKSWLDPKEPKKMSTSGWKFSLNGLCDVVKQQFTAINLNPTITDIDIGAPYPLKYVQIVRH